MKPLSIRLVLAFFASATVAESATYQVRHLDPNDALMGLSVRVPEISGDCKITPVHARDRDTAGVRGFLEVKCSTQANDAKIQAALDAIDVRATAYRFHVAVLTASRNDGPMPDLSAGEQKALIDFKKVMAYKSFQVDGEAILQTDRFAQTQFNGEDALELAINSHTGGGPSIDVGKLRLSRSRAPLAPAGTAQYDVFVDTSFSIMRGETVVLGTSKGDQTARVVLVTALP